MTWTLVLIVAVAFAIIVFAYKIRAVRFGNSWISLGASLAALAAGVAGLVLASRFYDDVFMEARGDKGWAEDGTIRLLLVLSFTAAIALWVWYLVKRKSHDD